MYETKRLEHGVEKKEIPYSAPRIREHRYLTSIICKPGLGSLNVVAVVGVAYRVLDASKKKVRMIII